MVDKDKVKAFGFCQGKSRFAIGSLSYAPTRSHSLDRSRQHFPQDCVIIYQQDRQTFWQFKLRLKVCRFTGLRDGDVCCISLGLYPNENSFWQFNYKPRPGGSFDSAVIRGVQEQNTSHQLYKSLRKVEPHSTALAESVETRLIAREQLISFVLGNTRPGILN